MFPKLCIFRSSMLPKLHMLPELCAKKLFVFPINDFLKQLIHWFTDRLTDCLSELVSDTVD